MKVGMKSIPIIVAFHYLVPRCSPVDFKEKKNRLTAHSLCLLCLKSNNLSA